MGINTFVCILYIYLLDVRSSNIPNAIQMPKTIHERIQEDALNEAQVLCLLQWATGASFATNVALMHAAVAFTESIAGLKHTKSG